jgi:general L-amino acid transport system permease protein
MTSAAVGPALPAPPRRLNLSSLLAQVAFLLVVAAVLGWLVANVAANLSRLGLQLGFAFLDLPAGFRIGESVIPYEARDSYGRALLVGLTNTLRVAVLGCLAASVLGFFVGILRLSRNPLLAFISSVYVETIRNTPVLLQLVLWHALILRLPPVRGALEPIPGVYLSQRGLNLPWIEVDQGLLAVTLVIALALAVWLVLARRARRRRELIGRAKPVWPLGLALVLGLPLVLALATGWSPTVSTPQLRGFNFVGGAAMTPEYAALLIGLIIYGAAFIGEIVRASIQAIGRGQWDAGRALGLREAGVLRLVIVPQALRLMIPPLTNQYLNLTKNTSLGVVVGFPELASITNTVINQTGQAIEALAIFMAVFLVLSLTTSALMNWYNARVALVER